MNNGMSFAENLAIAMFNKDGDVDEAGLSRMCSTVQKVTGTNPFERPSLTVALGEQAQRAESDQTAVSIPNPSTHHRLSGTFVNSRIIDREGAGPGKQKVGITLRMKNGQEPESFETHLFLGDPGTDQMADTISELSPGDGVIIWRPKDSRFKVFDAIQVELKTKKQDEDTVADYGDEDLDESEEDAEDLDESEEDAEDLDESEEDDRLLGLLGNLDAASHEEDEASWDTLSSTLSTSPILYERVFRGVQAIQNHDEDIEVPVGVTEFNQLIKSMVSDLKERQPEIVSMMVAYFDGVSRLDDGPEGYQFSDLYKAGTMVRDKEKRPALFKEIESEGPEVSRIVFGGMAAYIIGGLNDPEDE